MSGPGSRQAAEAGARARARDNTVEAARTAVKGCLRQEAGRRGSRARARDNTVEAARTALKLCRRQQAGGRGQSQGARDNTVEAAKPAVEPASAEDLPRQEAPASQSSKEANRNGR